MINVLFFAQVRELVSTDSLAVDGAFDNVEALRAHLAALDHPRDLTDLSNYWTLGQAAQD